MIENFNQLTPAETERLALLSEECAETIQIVGKILRHGYESCHPCDPANTNRRLLEEELGHVWYARIMLSQSGDISLHNVVQARYDKAKRIQKYLHHQPNSHNSRA